MKGDVTELYEKQAEDLKKKGFVTYLKTNKVQKEVVTTSTAATATMTTKATKEDKVEKSYYDIRSEAAKIAKDQGIEPESWKQDVLIDFIKENS